MGEFGREHVLERFADPLPENGLEENIYAFIKFLLMSILMNHEYYCFLL